jgi:hypothetical protein
MLTRDAFGQDSFGGDALGQDAFHRARAYLFEHGRPLDRERFRYHFESGSADAVMAELEAYQNGDGGFGHGIEADIRAADSSPIATATAFRVLREVGAPDHEIVRRGLAYLSSTFDRGRSVWEMVPPEVANAAHAPWWNYAETAETFEDFQVNPTAEILGELYDYAALVPAGLLADLTPIVVGRAEAMAKLEHNSFVALSHLAAAENLPAAARQSLQTRLLRAAPHSIALDPSRWHEYELEPLEALGTPASFLTGAIPPEAVRANIAYTIDRQLPDGSWPLTWEWASVDADAWAQAEREWKGKQIVDKIVALREFGAL